MNEDNNIGRVLDGKYELISLIGSGGMGGVYEAQHHLIGRRMAVKLLHAEYARDDNVVQRFKREATSTSAVGHDNIVEITDMGVTDTGELFLVMEYLDGRDLASVLSEVGRTSQGWACYIISQVLSALEATHAAGIVHRDLKPANVFVTARPETEAFVKLVDFGISKVRANEEGVTKGLTRTGEILGTPQYMSTEQARGSTEITNATDIYSAGVILYEMLTGQQPYQGKTYAEILFKILAEEPPDPTTTRPDLATDVAAAIRKAMASNPAQRFADASAFLAAVRPYADPSAAVAAGEIAASGPASRAPRGATAEITNRNTTPLALSSDVTVAPSNARKLIPWLAGAGGLVVVALLAVWFVLSRSAEVVPPVVPVPLSPSASAEATERGSTESASAEATAGSSSSKANPASPAAAEKATLTVQVTPAKALVSLDGKELGRGSGSWEVSADKDEHTVEVAAKGWSTASRTVSLDSDLTVVIELRRKGKGKEEALDEVETGAMEPTPPPEPTLVLVPKPPPEPTPPPAPAPAQPPEKIEKEEAKKEPEPAEEKKFKRQIDQDIPW